MPPNSSFIILHLRAEINTFSKITEIQQKVRLT